MAIPTLIIGCGSRGRDWLRLMSSQAEFKLVGAVDPDESALAEFRRLAGLDSTACFTSLSAAIDRTSPRVAIVASSEQHHVEPIRESLERSVGILVEKPFTIRYADALELVDLAERRHVPLVVAQNYRYMRLNRAIKRLVDDGTLGDVGIVIAQYYRPPHFMPPSVDDLRQRIMWRLSVHHFDAFRWTLGREFTRVAASSFATPWSDHDQGDSLHLLADMAGVRVTYQATYESTGHRRFEHGQEYYQRIVGTRGTLHVYHRWLLLFPAGSRFPRVIRRGARTISEEAILLGQLRRGLEGDPDYESSGRDNLGTMAALEAMTVSANENRWVDISEVTRA